MLLLPIQQYSKDLLKMVNKLETYSMECTFSGIMLSYDDPQPNKPDADYTNVLVLTLETVETRGSSEQLKRYPTSFDFRQSLSSCSFSQFKQLPIVQMNISFTVFFYLSSIPGICQYLSLKGLA